jgi:hypothetical protein
VRRGLADAIRDLEADTLEPGKARALVYAYATLASVMQGADLEQRLAKLEQASTAPRPGGSH